MANGFPRLTPDHSGDAYTLLSNPSAWFSHFGCGDSIAYVVMRENGNIYAESITKERERVDTYIP